MTPSWLDEVSSLRHLGAKPLVQVAMARELEEQRATEERGIRRRRRIRRALIATVLLLAGAAAAAVALGLPHAL